MVMLLPLIILAIGAIFAGFLFKDLFIGHGGENNFWGESIKFLSPLSTEHPTFMDYFDYTQYLLFFLFQLLIIYLLKIKRYQINC